MNGELKKAYFFLQLENPKCLLRLSATDFHVTQKRPVLKRCNTLCNRTFVARDKMEKNPNFQWNTFYNSLQEKVASNSRPYYLKIVQYQHRACIMWSVVISSAVLDRHELSKQNKTNKTDNGTHHLNQSCWKSTNPPPKTTQWLMELVKIVTHFNFSYNAIWQKRKICFHESLRTIDTIIVIAIISGQKLQRDISSLNKFVSFITCFYFQLFFSCYLVGRKKSTTYVSSNCLQQIDINNKKLRQLVSYIL